MLDDRARTRQTRPHQQLVPRHDTDCPRQGYRRGAPKRARFKARNCSASKDDVIRSAARVVRIETETRTPERKRPAVPQFKTLRLANRTLRQQPLRIDALLSALADNHAARQFIPKPNDRIRIDNRLRRTPRQLLLMSPIVRNLIPFIRPFRTTPRNERKRNERQASNQKSKNSLVHLHLSPSPFTE